MCERDDHQGVVDAAFADRAMTIYERCELDIDHFGAFEPLRLRLRAVER
jgi:hypothetical protein